MEMMFDTGLFGVNPRNAVRPETDRMQMAILGMAVRKLQAEQAARVRESIERRALQERVIESMVGKERYARYKGTTRTGVEGAVCPFGGEAENR